MRKFIRGEEESLRKAEGPSGLASISAGRGSAATVVPAAPTVAGANSPPPCRCCGSVDTFLFGQKQGAAIPQVFDYYQCRQCRFLFVSPYATSGIYDEAYYQGKGPDPFVSYEAEYRDYRATDRLIEMEDLKRVATEVLSKGRRKLDLVRWLDLGCGSGSLLKYLRDERTLDLPGGKVPIQLSGQDVGAWADRLREFDQFEIFDLATLQALPDASFDVISMIEVLEHIPEPQEAISLAARLLRPGGLLLLTTGNLQSIAARRQGLRYDYCVPEIHISLFNPQCLSLLYRACGLTPLRVRYRGVVAYKVIKTLLKPAQKRLGRWVVRVPLVLRAIDWLYGVSAMPCAIKAAKSVTSRACAGPC